MSSGNLKACSTLNILKEAYLQNCNTCILILEYRGQNKPVQTICMSATYENCAIQSNPDNSQIQGKSKKV